MSDTTTAPANKAVNYGGDKPARAPSGAAKKSVTRKKAKSAIKRGLVSEKAAKRHFGDV
jgi:hypothetical protein